MRRAKVDEALFRQVMERVWLLMGFVSVALSDHPLIKSNKSYRWHTDRARKALFDLHGQLELALAPQATHADDLEDHFGAQFLKLKGSIPKSVPIGFDEHKRAKSKRQRSRHK